MRQVIFSGWVLLLVSLGIARSGSLVQAPEPEPEVTDRGRYLTEVVGGCIDCHTPHQDGQPDRSRLFAGHPQDAPAPRWDPAFSESNIGLVIGSSGTAFAGPRGVSFASNLTPDPNTGIGSWNEALFIRTMRRGDFQMPMPSHLRELSRGDLKAIWAYLQTLKPIYNGVPKSRLLEAPQ